MNNEKIGILGGTFDPIHYGHLKIARYCKDKLSLGKILFVPAGNPPHKVPVEDYQDRASMVKLALEDKESYILAQYEKPKEAEADFNYTYETLSKVNEVYPNDELYFIIGEDNVPQIQNWYRYQDLFNLAQFVVLSREGTKDSDFTDLSYYDKLKFIKMPKIDISSEEIRKNLYENKNIKNFLPLKVWNYIKMHKLYIK